MSFPDDDGGYDSVMASLEDDGRGPLPLRGPSDWEDEEDVHQEDFKGDDDEGSVVDTEDGLHTHHFEEHRLNAVVGQSVVEGQGVEGVTPGAPSVARILQDNMRLQEEIDRLRAQLTNIRGYVVCVSVCGWVGVWLGILWVFEWVFGWVFCGCVSQNHPSGTHPIPSSFCHHRHHHHHTHHHITITPPPPQQQHRQRDYLQQQLNERNTQLEELLESEAMKEQVGVLWEGIREEHGGLLEDNLC